MSAAEWPRSLLPQDRDPTTWHPLQDGCAKLYRLIRPGETFAGMTVTVIDGRRTVRLVLVRGGTRRVVVDGEDEASWVLGAAPRRQAAAG